jgi:hypothetical protein
MHLMALHQIARSGDGLAPELLRLFAAREAQAADTRLVSLRNFNPAIPDVAGAYPDRPERNDILPGTPSTDRAIQRRRPPG